MSQHPAVGVMTAHNYHGHSSGRTSVHAQVELMVSLWLATIFVVVAALFGSLFTPPFSFCVRMFTHMGERSCIWCQDWNQREKYSFPHEGPERETEQQTRERERERGRKEALAGVLTRRLLASCNECRSALQHYSGVFQHLNNLVSSHPLVALFVTSVDLHACWLHDLNQGHFPFAI